MMLCPSITEGELTQKLCYERRCSSIFRIDPEVACRERLKVAMTGALSPSPIIFICRRRSLLVKFGWIERLFYVVTKKSLQEDVTLSL